MSWQSLQVDKKWQKNDTKGLSWKLACTHGYFSFVFFQSPLGCDKWNELIKLTSLTTCRSWQKMTKWTNRQTIIITIISTPTKSDPLGTLSRNLKELFILDSEPKSMKTWGKKSAEKFQAKQLSQSRIQTLSVLFLNRLVNCIPNRWTSSLSS